MKNRWFFETLYPDIRLGLKIRKKLYQGKSKFQKIKFLETKRFGKTLILDEVIQTTTVDEFIYHEMITHIPLFSHPNPQNVLIIGGGDAGVLRETLKHKTIKKVTLVEIDKKVIEYSQKYLKEIVQGAFKSKKLKLVIQDAAEYVKNSSELYDIVIIDSPDPIGPAEVLFQIRFYQNISNLLSENGIMVRQSGSTFLQQEELRENYKRLKRIFNYTAVYISAIPTYIGGFFSFIFCSQRINPQKLTFKRLKQRFTKLGGKTKYYNPRIHLASFELPNYINEIIGRK